MLGTMEIEGEIHPPKRKVTLESIIEALTNVSWIMGRPKGWSPCTIVCP